MAALHRLCSALLPMAALLFAGAAAEVRAEVSEIHVAQQYGVGFLPLMVMARDHLVEAQALRQGLTLKVSWSQVAGPAVMNDGLLSGSLQFVATGSPALATLWAKTRDGLAVHGVAAMTSYPLSLNTRNPRVRTVRDLGPGDRIALTSIKVSYQAVLLQMLAAREFGMEQHTRFDALTVGMAHPDALLAFINGTGGVNAHFATSPFHEQEVQLPGVRTLTTSTEILGGRASASIISTTARFRADNPKVYRAFLDALGEAIAQINRDKAAAARAYVELAHDTRDSPEAVLRMISAPDYAYTLTPEKVFKVADFLYRSGAIKVRPASWKDLFFPEIHHLQGD